MLLVHRAVLGTLRLHVLLRVSLLLFVRINLRAFKFAELTQQVLFRAFARLVGEAAGHLLHLLQLLRVDLSSFLERHLHERGHHLDLVSPQVSDLLLVTRLHLQLLHSVAHHLDFFLRKHGDNGLELVVEPCGALLLSLKVVNGLSAHAVLHAPFLVLEHDFADERLVSLHTLQGRPPVEVVVVFDSLLNSFFFRHLFQRLGLWLGRRNGLELVFEVGLLRDLVSAVGLRSNRNVLLNRLFNQR